MANISAIKLPSGNTYNLVDKTSGFVTTDTTYSAGTGLSLSGTTFSNSGVIGVKGNAESSYRTGNVNITADNVQAIPKNVSGNTQMLKRPQFLQGCNDITIDSKINTLRANRLAFLPADQIIIEKTIDGGETWTDAEVSDANKLALFSETRPSIALPKIDGKKNPLCGLRITFTAMKYDVPDGTSETAKYNYWNSNYVVSAERYNQIKEMYFWVSVSGGYMQVKVERAKGNSPTDWSTIFHDSTFKMIGYSGNDYISFSQGVFGGGITQTSNFWNYRITFMTDSELPTGNYLNYDQTIMEIRGYGDTWWNKGNEYAANDKIFTHDSSQNVFFPGSIYPLTNNVKTLGSNSNKWNSVYATTFYGNLTGDVTGTASGNLTSNSTLSAAKLSGAIPSAVTATTQSASDNSTKIATTAFVQAAMSSAGAGTVTSVGVSNATNGGLSISGSPITSSGTITIGHSNVLSSAQTTQAVYPIKIDKNGHISAYGSAVTIPTIPSNIVTGTGSTDRLAMWSGKNTLSITSLSIDTSYDTSSDLYGTIKLYVGSTGQIDWRGQLVLHDGSSSNITITPSSLTSSRIITLPDKTGTIALTDDIPTVTDENVKSTAVTTATTNYIVGSTTSTTTTGGLSKHASGVLYTTADSGTSGYTQLRLGNTTATSSAGGKEGQIRLYGTTATYYVDLKAGAPSANRTITLPNKTGTIALTDDIPTVPSNIVNTITTTAGAHTAITNQKGNVSFSIPTTAAHVGAAASDHTHGNITNGGDITATAPTIASGDQIIINDNSASKITNGPTFDGSTTTKALTPKGTWETFLKSYTETDPTVPSWAKASTKPSYTASEVGALPDTTTIPSNTSDLNNDSGFITLSDVPNISSLIIVDTHTPTGYEFTSSQNRSITTNLQSHSGYTPYALKCVCTNKASIRIYNYYISSGTIVFEAINTTSSKVTGVNFNIQILWIKNTILGS